MRRVLAAWVIGALLVLTGLQVGAQSRSETFTWTFDPNAVAYRLYVCDHSCWRPDWTLRTQNWSLVADTANPAFIVTVPDQQAFFLAANVYPGGVEVLRRGVGWVTVPGASTENAPMGLHVP